MSESCGSYFYSNPIRAMTYDSNIKDITYTFTQTGYYKLSLMESDQQIDFVPVSKGYIIYLNQDGTTARLAMDTSGTASFTDYVIHSYDLFDIEPNKNIRLYLKCLVDMQFYFSSISLSHYYEKIGSYNLTVALQNSSLFYSKRIIINASIERFYFKIYTS